QLCRVQRRAGEGVVHAGHRRPRYAGPSILWTARAGGGADRMSSAAERAAPFSRSMLAAVLRVGAAGGVGIGGYAEGPPPGWAAGVPARLLRDAPDEGVAHHSGDRAAARPADDGVVDLAAAAWRRCLSDLGHAGPPLERQHRVRAHAPGGLPLHLVA